MSHTRIRRLTLAMTFTGVLLMLAAASANPPSKPRKPDAPPASQPAQSQPAQPNTTVPAVRAEQWWIDRHNRELQMKKLEKIGIVFVGDSITQGWEQTGAKAWDQHYAKRGGLNLGFSGDRTQHVLWRLMYKEVEDLSPKVAVVMIGTNNSNGNDNTAEEIAAGIKAIVASLREKLPSTRIILLAIFPRGEQPNAQREKNAKASQLASAVADDKMVFYMDIGPKFLNADGSISKDIMPDFLHLSDKGYQIWADAIEPKVSELMGDATPATKPAAP